MSVLSAGDRIGVATLQAVTKEGSLVSLDLSNLDAVLFFFPKADTPGCTKQACAVRDIWEFLSYKSNVTVIGISRDSQDDLIAFGSKYSLPFPLVSDSDSSLCNKFGVLSSKGYIIRSHAHVCDGVVKLIERKIAPHDTAKLAQRIATKSMM